MGWYMVKSGLIDKPDVIRYRLGISEVLCPGAIPKEIILMLPSSNIYSGNLMTGVLKQSGGHGTVNSPGEGDEDFLG